jgi:hypothetical protein
MRWTLYLFSRCSTPSGRSNYHLSPNTSLEPYQNRFALPRVTSDVAVQLFNLSMCGAIHDMDAITSRYRALEIVEIAFHSSKIFEVLKEN